jgi:hypothetical protein
MIHDPRYRPPLFETDIITVETPADVQVNSLACVLV